MNEIYKEKLRNIVGSLQKEIDEIERKAGTLKNERDALNDLIESYLKEKNELKTLKNDLNFLLKEDQ